MDGRWHQQAKTLRKRMTDNVEKLDELIAEAEAVGDGTLVNKKRRWPPTFKDWLAEYVEFSEGRGWPKPGVGLKGMYYQATRAVKELRAPWPTWESVTAGADAMLEKFEWAPPAPGWLVGKDKSGFPNILRMLEHAKKQPKSQTTKIKDTRAQIKELLNRGRE